MHSLALALGLTAALYAFLLRRLVYWLPLPIPSYITVVICMVAAWLVATNVARRLEPSEPPPEWEWTSRALVFAASLYLLMELLRRFFHFRVLDYKDWVMLVILALTVRHLKPRAMLFLGVLAFAMQLGLTQILGLLGGLIKLPDWVVYLLNLGVAAWVANWLCFRPDVATDRVKSLEVLWFFGAAGVATMFIGADNFMFRSWTESLVWLSYLVSFLLLIRHIGEGEEESEGETADLHRRVPGAGNDHHDPAAVVASDLAHLVAVPGLRSPRHQHAGAVEVATAAAQRRAGKEGAAVGDHSHGGLRPPRRQHLRRQRRG
jgi:hypothetical protein